MLRRYYIINHLKKGETALMKRAIRPWEFLLLTLSGWVNRVRGRLLIRTHTLENVSQYVNSRK
jgi:hypothetical protein